MSDSKRPHQATALRMARSRVNHPDTIEVLLELDLSEEVISSLLHIEAATNCDIVRAAKDLIRWRDKVKILALRWYRRDRPAFFRVGSVSEFARQEAAQEK